VVGCPKLDDVQGYKEKLTDIFKTQRDQERDASLHGSPLLLRAFEGHGRRSEASGKDSPSTRSKSAFGTGPVRGLRPEGDQDSRAGDNGDSRPVDRLSDPPDLRGGGERGSKDTEKQRREPPLLREKRSGLTLPGGFCHEVRNELLNFLSPHFGHSLFGHRALSW